MVIINHQVKLEDRVDGVTIKRSPLRPRSVVQNQVTFYLSNISYYLAWEWADCLCVHSTWSLYIISMCTSGEWFTCCAPPPALLGICLPRRALPFLVHCRSIFLRRTKSIIISAYDSVCSAKVVVRFLINHVLLRVITRCLYLSIYLPSYLAALLKCANKMDCHSIIFCTCVSGKLRLLCGF